MEKSPVAGPAFVYEGSYHIAGQGADGSKYVGTGTITRIGGSMYASTMSIGLNLFTAVGIVDRGGALCFGWAVKAKDANVITYDVLPDGAWDGVWFESADTTLGRELGSLVGTNGTTRKLTGQFPNGGSYHGTLKVTRRDSMSTEEFATDELDWIINGRPSHGVAISIGSLVAAAFADTGREFGTLMLVPNAQRAGFTGPWAQSINGVASVGSETWTKQ